MITSLDYQLFKLRAPPWEHPKGALRAAVRWGRQIISINSLSNSYIFVSTGMYNLMKKM